MTSLVWMFFATWYSTTDVRWHQYRRREICPISHSYANCWTQFNYDSNSALKFFYHWHSSTWFPVTPRFSGCWVSVLSIFFFLEKCIENTDGTQEVRPLNTCSNEKRKLSGSITRMIRIDDKVSFQHPVQYQILIGRMFMTIIRLLNKITASFPWTDRGVDVIQP